MFPVSNIFLDLKLDNNYCVGVYGVNGGMVGHVASEHVKLVTRATMKQTHVANLTKLLTLYSLVYFVRFCFFSSGHYNCLPY